VTERDPELWARRSSSFGASARAYAEHRPDYSADAIAWCLAGADRPVHDVLDLAAGTGALTGGLLAAGVSVTAVEPDEQMLAELRRRLPGVPAVLGRAEAIPVADGSTDAVLVGTAFHWFDLDRALPEIARVLRPGGVLGVLYSVPDTSVPWVAELDQVSRSSVSMPHEEPSGFPEYAGFGPVALVGFAHSHRRTAESLTATIGTQSHTIVIGPDERAALLARVQGFLEADPATGAGEFDHPLVTVAYRARVDD
jgi:SAM-dependent methyltransferase